MTHDPNPNNPVSYLPHGLLTGPRSVTYAGVIPYIVRNPSGDWTPYLPDGELQRGQDDSMACVSYSLLHSIETQEYFLTGKRVRYSARWLAKISGTTPAGNYFVTVADTIRRYGLVLESSYPTPPNFTWASYYADIDPATLQNLLLEGSKWLKTHNLASEFRSTDLSDILEQIKQAPLQIGLPGHAVVDFYTPSEIVNYFDTYIPFRKQTGRSNLTDVYKNVLTLKHMLRLVNDNGTIYLVGDKGKVGLADMGALNDMQALDSAPIEMGSTIGVPQVGIFETGLTYHK